MKYAPLLLRKKLVVKYWNCGWLRSYHSIYTWSCCRVGLLRNRYMNRGSIYKLCKRHVPQQGAPHGMSFTMIA